MIQALAFYLFAGIVIASAVMVIMSRNPVHSVLWLILAFFNAAGLMVLVGAEFIAMLLVIVAQASDSTGAWLSLRVRTLSTHGALRASTPFRCSPESR